MVWSDFQQTIIKFITFGLLGAFGNLIMVYSGHKSSHTVVLDGQTMIHLPGKYEV